MTYLPAEILRENVEIANRIQRHFERSYHQIAKELPLQPEQVSQLTNYSTLHRISTSRRIPRKTH